MNNFVLLISIIVGEFFVRKMFVGDVLFFWISWLFNLLFLLLCRVILILVFLVKLLIQDFIRFLCWVLYIIIFLLLDFVLVEKVSIIEEVSRVIGLREDKCNFIKRFFNRLKKEMREWVNGEICWLYRKKLVMIVKIICIIWY